MVDSAKENVIYKLIETEEDRDCTIFTLPIQLVKNRAEQFINDDSTKSSVETYAKQKEIERKKNAMGFGDETDWIKKPSTTGSCRNNKKKGRESPDSNSEYAPKKRRAKAPDFFLATQACCNLMLVASKGFLIEVMKGHLLYDYINDNLNQRYTSFEKEVGDRLKGIAIANFVDKIDGNGPDITFSDWRWEMRSRNDIMDDLKNLVGNADYAHAVLRYCLPHYNALNAIRDLPMEEYLKALDGIRDASLHTCSKCGLEFPVAYSKQVIVDRQSNDEKDLFFCLYCTSTFNEGSTLLPQKAREIIMVIMRLLKEYTESRYRSPDSFKKAWEMKLLSTKQPSKKKFVFAMFGGMTQITKDIKEELLKYKMHYMLQDTKPPQRVHILRKADSLLRRVMTGLREAFSPLYNRIHNEVISWYMNEGITIFANLPNNKSTKLLPAPSHTTSLMISLAEVSKKDGFAKWILVPPISIDNMVSWMKAQNCINRPLTLEEMEKAAKDMKEIVVYKQQPGEVVTVPVGWAYCVYHNEPSLQLSFDWIERNTLHLCTLSYIHCWRQLTDMSPDIHSVKMNFMSTAISKLSVFK